MDDASAPARFRQHPGALATLSGAGAIVLWAFLALLTRSASDLPPLQLVAMTFAVSGLLGLGVVAVRGRLHLLRQPPGVWLHGVGGLGAYHALYFGALGLAPAAEANLINYSWPLLIVLLAAPVLGLRLGASQLIGASLAAIGCALLLVPGAQPQLRGPSVWLGDAMALAAALIWAVYSLIARRMHHVPTEAVAGFCAATALLATIAHLTLEPTVAPTAQSWLAVLAIGAGPAGGAFFLWDIGMKHGDPRLLGTLAYATPVASTLLLCAAGFASWSIVVGLAAVMVAAGGLVAARPARAL